MPTIKLSKKTIERLKKEHPPRTFNGKLYDWYASVGNKIKDFDKKIEKYKDDLEAKNYSVRIIPKMYQTDIYIKEKK